MHFVIHFDPSLDLLLGPDSGDIMSHDSRDEAEPVLRSLAHLHLDLNFQRPTPCRGNGLVIGREAAANDSDGANAGPGRGGPLTMPPLSINQVQVQPARVPDWSNLEVIHRNTLAPRSHFFLYDSVQDALAADVGRARSLLLSGTWGFNLTNGPFNGPTNFYEPTFDNSSWDIVKVPGMWQCQGFGKGPQYTNVNYPFPVNPPHVPYDDNECGRYVTKFAVPSHLQDGDQWRLRFEGVDSAFTVWLNGHKVGYSQGSRNPSEFDVTGVLDVDSSENYLAVEVYQWCDGSYIEDQVWFGPSHPNQEPRSLIRRAG